MPRKQSKPQAPPTPSTKKRGHTTAPSEIAKLKAPQKLSRTEIAVAAASAEMEQLRPLLKQVPSLAELITCRSVRERAAMAEKIAAALEHAEAASSALATIPRKASSSPAKTSADQLRTEARDAQKLLKDMLERAETLSPGMEIGVTDLPLLSRKQEFELISEMQRHRSLFWEKLFELPFVQNAHFQDLLRVVAKELQPDTVIATGKAGASDNETLLQDARRCVRAVKKNCPGCDLLSLPSDKRALVAEILVATRPSPDTSLDFFAKAKSLSSDLSALESKLLCRHNSLEAARVAAEEQCDPDLVNDLVECNRLRALLGGSALKAHEKLSRLEALATPYLDLKNYVALANKGLVLAHISRSAKLRLFQDDLIQEAYIGLLRAAERFDQHSGWKFSTYATWWIRQASDRAFSSISRLIQLPTHSTRTLGKIFHALNDLETACSAEDVAAKTGLPEKEIAPLLAHVRGVSSMHAPLASNDDTSRLDLIPDRSTQNAAEEAESSEQRSLVLESLRHLSEREQTVLILRFGLAEKPPQTLEEAGKVLGVTRERVRQIEKKAISRLALVASRSGTVLNSLRKTD